MAGAGDGLAAAAVEAPQAIDAPPGDAYEPLLDRLTRAGATEDDRREAAELLHALGTSDALGRLGTRPGHASARALLRDARWDAPGAGEVPVLGAPAPFAVARELLRLRLRHAARIAARRWAGAAAGGGLAGVAAGAAGGLILAAAPGSAAPVAIAPVLAVIGGVCGALGGAGVGGGLSLAEAGARSLTGASPSSRRRARWRRRRRRPSSGSPDGVSTRSWACDLGDRRGARGIRHRWSRGIGYAIATRNVEGGMAAPRGRRLLRAAAITAAVCGLAGLVLSLAGRPLVGGTIHVIARTADGSAGDARAVGTADRGTGFRPGFPGDHCVRREGAVRPWAGARPDAPPRH